MVSAKRSFVFVELSIYLTERSLIVLFQKPQAEQAYLQVFWTAHNSVTVVADVNPSDNFVFIAVAIDLLLKLFSSDFYGRLL